MIHSTVNEIEKCIENELYLAAIMLALTLPDVCSQVEYPEIDNTSDRYKKWISDKMDKFDNPANHKGKEWEAYKKYPYFGSKNIYALRCALFHESNPNVNVKNVDKFVLYGDKEGLAARISKRDEYTEYSVNVVDLCRRICWCAMVSYDENKELFKKEVYKIHSDPYGSE